MAKAVAAVRLKAPYLLEGNETLSKGADQRNWLRAMAPQRGNRVSSASEPGSL